MNSIIATIRAVGTEFVNRTVRSLVKPFAIGAIVIASISIWLLHFSLWWLVVTVPLFLAIIAGVGILLAANIVVRRFSQKLSQAQHTAVGNFVDKLQRVSDNVQVPMFLVVFRVIRDIVRPHENSYISILAKDSTSLYKDFLSLRRLF